MAGNELPRETMSERHLEAVAQFHQRVSETSHIVPAALRYEYFQNPDPGSGLHLACDGAGRVVATQAFVAQTLVRGGSRHSTLMSERTLLDPALRGKAGFTEFYVQGMAESCAAAHAEFVWGGTAAVKAFARFGFDVDDCFFEVILVSSLEPIRALLTSRTSTAKQKLFYTFAYGRSLARRLVRRATGRRHVVRVETLHPGSAALDGFLRAFPAAHPDSLFMEYSPRKLAWLVTENPFRSRELLFLRSAGELSGLAIVEREPGGIATVADLLILPPDQIEAHCAAVADHLARQGIGAARLFGNAKNRYVASLRAAFSKLGAVPLPARAQLVIRGPGDAPERHPAVSELALTQIWSPPL